MTKFSLTRRLIVGAMVALIGLSSIAQARPLQFLHPLEQDAKKSLPPVNWIRSRKIDVKHLDIDLRFDWEKEQAIGSTVVVFSPFNDTDTVSLDAAMMTIDAVSLAAGKKLTFSYDGKRDNDNLAITLDRIYRAGEEVRVKVDYKTNYVNKVDDTDTSIGSFGRGLRFIKPTADNPNKPRQIWSQGETEFNRYWFPSYDTPNDFRTTTSAGHSCKAILCGWKTES